MPFLIKYKIIKKYLTGPSLRRPVLPLDKCRFIVAHDTGTPGSTASGNVRYYERSRDEMEASAHLFVDDNEIIECIPFLTGEPEKAWHVVYAVGTDNRLYGADANDAAGGVEFCYGGNINMQEAYKRLVWLLAYSCWRYGLNPGTDITGHYILDPTRKIDPLSALKLIGKSFNDLIADVTNEYYSCLEEEENLPMKFEYDWQWKMLGDALDGLYKNGLITDYKWVEKALKRELTSTELTWLNTIVYARQNGIKI